MTDKSNTIIEIEDKEGRCLRVKALCEEAFKENHNQFTQQQEEEEDSSEATIAEIEAPRVPFIVLNPEYFLNADGSIPDDWIPTPLPQREQTSSLDSSAEEF